ncbi:MAG: penicillin-binding protein activator [Rhodospirillales bacterium]|nr:penicillin-binding protein activator [Rhodospirillales bacterium]
MRRRSLLLLGTGLGLGGCAVDSEGGYGGFYPIPSAGSAAGYGAPESLGAAPARRAPLGAPSGPVGLLVPLSGQLAAIGAPLRNAAALALAEPGSPPVLVEDTAGSPDGAARAAAALTGRGARMLLGPLTAAETSAAAPAATGAGVPMLAFTNDPGAARPGVWTLGITPGQQVRALVRQAMHDGRTRFAALLPDTPFGRLMADGLSAATREAGSGPPTIRFHGGGMASINGAARALSDYAGRWGPIEAKIRAASAAGTLAGRREAAKLRKSVPPPPPFDALLLADTGEALSEVVAVLDYYVVGPPSVRIMGPALWADPRSGAGRLPGSWYAAPDPDLRRGFAAAYAARYGAPPPGLADLAYDAGALARVLAPLGDSSEALTSAAGFAGADGLLVLRPDGHVRRGLAVFSVARDGGHLVAPPPPRLPA